MFMSESAMSLINKALYYWDWYLLKGDKDNLVAALAFMQSYRKAGGTDYCETEQAMLAHCEPTPTTAPLQTVNCKLQTPTAYELIFGLTWQQIQNKQQKP